jgi:hypothetical protein
MAMSLAIGIPFRGAVCFGMGVELSPNNFYGPVLAEADYLEKKIADYPRILVSGRVLEFARGRFPFSESPRIRTFMGEMAQKALPFLTKDQDGHTIVDFCGQGVFDFADEINIALMKEAISKAHSFVRAQVLRFAEPRNDKLLPRYQILLEYMESRLPIWGLENLRTPR